MSELTENAFPPIEESGRDDVHSPGAADDSVPVSAHIMGGNVIQDGSEEETCMLPTVDAALLKISSEVVAEAAAPENIPADQTQDEFGGDMDPDSDADSDDEVDENDGLTSPVEEKDLAVQRNNLIARLKVVEAMLQQVAMEEKLRIQKEAASLLVKAGANNKNLSNISPLDETMSEKKRQRRPNPKYFDSEIEVDFHMPVNSPVIRRASYREEGPVSLNAPDSQGLKNSPNTNVASTAPPEYHLGRIGRPPMIQRARTAVAKKHRVFSLSEGPTTVIVTPDSNLENLSIRELHEAYRKAFGKDTSVKDKHWLKRQIFIGLSKRNGDSTGGKENNHNRKGRPSSGVANLKGRREKNSTAEMRLSTSSVVSGKRKSKGSDGSSNESKKAHRKSLSLAGLSAPDFPELHADGECSEGDNQTGDQSHGHEQERSLIGEKRVRKPNPKYFEDEADLSLGYGNISVLSTLPGRGNGLKSDLLRLAWKDDGEVEKKSWVSVNKSSRASTRSSASSTRRSRQASTGMKKKTDAHAAKLAKLAESARSARLDAQRTIRKVKFRLPAAPGQEKGESLIGEDGEQVSCLLPMLDDQGLGDDDPIDSQDQTCRSEENYDQAVVTVPTANGGTRRKHHRPWTLREVLTLVEGVARCGGGKWADIKKLAFSNVSYRTAVDLKDKWRNLLRASRAQLHPPKQGEIRRKQFSAAIPSQLLARVRELAALNNQPVPNISGTGTSRSGRTVHRT
ncbi:hypothetical protein R1flu_028719 [Riccia fluitans]|uniref:Uncharacterized protein n=1 Tax=Riccia fluitans TaxID=41844 RepID=A0ABD1XMI6_9MARC